MAGSVQMSKKDGEGTEAAVGRHFGKVRSVGLFILLVMVSSLTGCQESYLEPYQVKLEGYEQLEQSLYRQTGMAEGKSVIEDESVFDASEVSAAAAGMFCLDSERVLYSKAAFEPLAPASLTKLMTALVTLENASLDETVRLGEEVLITEPGARLCYFQPGDILTVEQLLCASLIYSGNDAAAALAVHVGGSEQDFVNMMNEEARRLGATSTKFKNSHGLDADGHVTTVYDLYLIFSRCLEYDDFCRMIAMSSYDCTYQTAEGTSKQVTWLNSNGFMNGAASLSADMKMLGGKTGTTEDAGKCLLVYTEDVQGRRYISILLGAADDTILYDEMNRLLQKIAE